MLEVQGLLRTLILFLIFLKVWNASHICVSSLHRGHANLLQTVPVLEYVLPSEHLLTILKQHGNQAKENQPLFTFQGVQLLQREENEKSVSRLQPSKPQFPQLENGTYILCCYKD